MNSEIIAAAKEHAWSVWPNESCGLVVNRRGRLVYRGCHNVAERPWTDFVISPEEYADVELCGEVVAVVHSHPNAAGTPSLRDQAMHRASGVDWLILGFPEGQLGEIDLVTLKAPAERPSLTGRVFMHGIADCYSIIRDYYAQELEIVLPDFPRQDEWWNKGENLYLKHYAEAGFREVQTMQKNDLILMTIGSTKINHGAVLVRPESGVILHHLTGRLSCEEVYTAFYRDRTRMILRHENY